MPMQTELNGVKAFTVLFPLVLEINAYRCIGEITPPGGFGRSRLEIIL